MARPKKQIDYILLSYFIILLIFGLVMLSSASTVVGFDKFDDSYFFVKRQLLFGVLPGLVLFFIFSKLPIIFFRKTAIVFYIVSLILLALVFVPNLGSGFNTAATSWIVIGDFSFQPAEIMKLGLIIFLSAYLAAKGKKIKDLRDGFLPALFLGLIPVFLVILQPDMGTALILFIIVFGMLYLAGSKLTHLIALLAAGLSAFVALIAFVPYRAARLMTFLHPELDPQGIGYHINQAFLAIGSGGIFGLGLGHSRQKFQYLPEVHADSIFAIIAEEAGFMVSVLFLFLLVLITLRCLKIAKYSPDKFMSLVVVGITCWFIVQSLFNIGAMIGVLPITGVPLPFVSHGGTALMVSMAAVGIIINISRYRYK